jgi:hypothetical protein
MCELPPLPSPTPADAEALVAARLAPFWRGAGVEPPYPAYPFSRRFFDSMCTELRPTLRRVLVECGATLANMRRDGRIAECAGAIAGVEEPALAAAYRRALLEVRTRPELAGPAARQERLRSAVLEVLKGSEAIQGIQIAEVEAPEKPRAGPRPPIVVALRSGALTRRLALEVHGDSARSALLTIERLQGRLEWNEADLAVLLREASAPIGGQARKTHEMLEKLGPGGGVEYLEVEAADRLVAADLMLESCDRRLAMAHLLAEEGLGQTLAPLLQRVLGSAGKRRAARGEPARSSAQP